jgi:alkylation response protein AidB-like acyl-CoA dehydrogenase
MTFGIHFERHSMDFTYTDEQEAFRQRVRDFVAENLPKNSGRAGSPQSGAQADREFLNQWQRKLYDAGLLGISWPKQYGGGGKTEMELAIFNEEMAKAGAPVPNVSVFGPVLLAHGSEEQKQRYLHKALSAEEHWCLGLSEPGAGSDLGSLRTRAELVGDEFIVNGQKCWNSGAHHADFCMLLTRTDPKAPKHMGLTYMIVDMKTPGVEVRPLRQITGSSDFNEMFFTNVRVPRTNVVGEINGGWRVAISTLSSERGNLALATVVDYLNIFDDLVKMARETTRNGRPAVEHPLVRQQLAQFYVDLATMKYTLYRNFTMWMKGAAPGPEGSINKLAWSELNQKMYDFALALQGHASQLMPGSTRAIADGRWTFGFLRSRANTIEAGTSEIHRNAIAERLLGMPKGR